MLFWIILWILILFFNFVYSFLPPERQKIPCLKRLAILSAFIILIVCICQVVQWYRNRIFSYVSKDGVILESKNFPWKIIKSINQDGNIVYLINDLDRNPSEVLVSPDNSNKEYKVRDAYDGVTVIFTCSEEKISNFKIKIKN